MPDGDVIKRGVRHAWRSAYEGLSSGGRDADVQGLVAKSLTASLRKRGLPPIAEAASLVRDAWSGRVAQWEALDRVAATVGALGGTRAAAMLDVATRRAILDGPSGALPEQAIAEAYLNVLVDADLIAKVRPALLENVDVEPQDVEEVLTRWTQEIQEPIQGIAQQLVADPTGDTLRAPPSRRRVRKNTATMLDESV